MNESMNHTSYRAAFAPKKITTEDEPVAEKNDEYGADEEYYDEHDNRIEDNNDYYE